MDESKFLRVLGLQLDEVGPSRVTAHVELGADHLTPWGVVHGGVYATIVESMASIGGSAAVEDQGMYAVGLHNGTDFLRASTGGRANAVATAIQQGRTQQLWLVEISSADTGKALARGQLRLQNVPLNR